MTNAIDVLVIGGPADGKMVCMPRPASTYIEFPYTLPDDSLLRYTRRKWTDPNTGKVYHIATRDEDMVTDEQIAWTITIANFQPGWDLNR